MVEKTRLYQYVARNLLNEPEFYFYSAFEGSPFLKEYQSQRRKTLIQLAESYQEALPLQQSTSLSKVLGGLRGLKIEVPEVLSAVLKREAPEEKSDVLPSREEIDASDPIPTEGALRRILRDVLEREQIDHRTGDCLTRFLKCFEVTKRLYAAYTPKMRPASESFQVLTPYALLALSLGVTYKRTKNLKYLNSALKLNDLLCSVEGKLVTCEDIALTLLTLNLEAHNVQSLAARQGVPL